MLEFFQKCYNAIGDRIVSIGPSVIDFAQNVLVAIILLVVGLIVIKVVLNLIDKATTKAKMDVTIKKFLISVLKFGLYCVLIIIVCAKVGIETTTFIAVLSSAGLALGLAMQGSLANLAGSVIILVTRPFKVGDYIVDHGSGQEGTVHKIDLVYTCLITGDNRMVTIPNGALANSAVTNVSAFGTRRVSIQANIKYTSDVELAKNVMLKMANEDERVLKDQEIFAFVNTLGPSSVLMEVRFWVNSADLWSTTVDMNEKVKKVFEENGIEITCGQVVVQMLEAK